MTKGEILMLFGNLNQLGGLNGVKFSYGVAKNLNILKPEIESLEKSLEMPEKFQEFERERIALVEKYTEKDENGKPKKETAANGAQQYVMGKEVKKFEKEFTDLKGKYKEAVGLRDKQIEEYTKLLTTDSEVKVYKVKLEDVPKEINARQMAGIYEIVQE